METNGRRVFILDDDASARLLAIGALDEMDCELHEFASGEDLLAAHLPEPDVCLFDVELPGISGIEVCRALRERGNDHAHVIFASSHDDIETRLAAYDAGGNDYLIKPFLPDEITYKVQSALRHASERESLSSQLSFATQTAFGAMSTLAEMGAVMTFMRKAFASTSTAELARAILEPCNQYDLKVILSISFGGRLHYYSTQGECSLLEQSILAHAKLNDRITEFSGRLSITYPQMTMLVMNFPKSDPERGGRLRDHLAFIAEAAEICIGLLAHEMKRQTRTGTIVQAVSDLGRTLDHLRDWQHEQRAQVLRMISDQGMQVANSFYSMGLSDAQEQNILELISRGGSEIGKFLQSAGDNEERLLRGIIANMSNLAAE